MEETVRTMEARLSAITASLNESRALLASCARRLGVKEQEWEATKASVATMTTSLLAPDPVREKPETKPSSPSFVSADWVVAAGALHGGAVVTPTMPTRCSALGSAVNVGNKPAVLVFLASGMTHLPAPTLTGAVDRALHGPGDIGMNTPAGCSTYVLTSPREGFVDGARTVNTDRPCNNSFPRFDGTNPGLWREKCLEFFTKFNICKPFWTTAARMHMVGKAKEWLEAYRLCQVVVVWPEFIDDVEAHFGVGNLPPSTTIFGAAHPSVDVHESGDISPNVMHTTVASMKPIAASYEEVLTHVGSISLFLEPCVKPAGVVFSEPHPMEFEDDVFTIVGGLSLFLEKPMNSLEEPKVAADTSIGLGPAASGVHMVYLKMPLEDVNNRCSLILPWDPGTQGDIIHDPIFGLSYANNSVKLSLPWDPGKQEAVIKGLFCLQTHAERCVSQCNLCVISILRKDAKIMQVATDPILKKMSSWRRSGFSPGYCMQPHLGITPSSRSNVSPDCLPIILAKFDRCLVEWLAPHKCIVNVAKAAVCILINLTLGDVFCLILKIFRSAVSPVDMIQKLYLANNIQSYEGSVWTVANQHTFLVNSQYTVQLHGHLMSRYRCLIFVLLMRSSQPMVQVTKILAYFRWLEVQMIYRSVIIFLVDFSLVVEATTATESEKHFRHVTLKYRNVHWNGLLVHQIQQEACSRCYFHMQSRLFGFDIHQLCNMKTHDGIPWDPGGIHGSRILAIAWGQAMFCPDASVTPRVYAGMGLDYWWLYMGLGQLNTWSRKDKVDERHGGGHRRTEQISGCSRSSLPSPTSPVAALHKQQSPTVAALHKRRYPSSRPGDRRRQRGVTCRLISWFLSAL